MEYIYLLQRESDIKYNVFKAGMSTKPIANRLRAADYRRADIYLVRGVNNSKLAEEEIFKTLNKLGYIQARIAYPKIEFGKEDYVIKNNIYDVVDIINKICNKYKCNQNVENENLTENESENRSENGSEDSIEIDSLDSSDSDNSICIQNEQIPPLLKIELNENNENNKNIQIPLKLNNNIQNQQI